jgi:hypothetical protein
MSWSFAAPAPWTALSDQDREQGHFSSDLCVIGGEQFFVRGLVEIPVRGSDGPFAWNVWVSISKENFLRVSDCIDDPERVNEPAYFGWLCNSIPGYPETFLLKTMLHTRALGLRPLIELEPTDHPLALEQKNGITMNRVREIAEKMYHANF